MADTDIGRELCEKIRAVFNSRIAGDTTIAAIRKKVENGRATMNDMSVYSRQLGLRLRQAIESTVRPENLPDETMYQNIAHSILDPLLRENYDEINRICAETQRELDRKARIGLTPQAAEYPAERVMTASFGAAAKELASDAIKVLGRTSENITASASDEYMKTNAEYRSKAGLDAYIVRTDGAGCCKWCAALAGKFKYPDDIPDDVFRRHDNCTCDVSYICDKGRQNVHTKKWTNEPRKIEYEKPVKRTREEARAIELNLMSNSFRPQYSSAVTEISVDDILISTKAVENSSFNIITDIDATKRNKAVRLAEKLLSEIKTELPQGYDIPQVAVIDFDKHNLGIKAIAGYHAPSGILFLNSKYDTKGKIIEYVNLQKGQFANTSDHAPILHEIGHDYYEKSVKALAKSQNIEYNNAKAIIDGRIYDYIHDRNDDGLFLVNNISRYADEGYSDHSYTEIIAECFSIRDKNPYAKDLFELLRGEQI